MVSLSLIKLHLMVISLLTNNEMLLKKIIVLCYCESLQNISCDFGLINGL